MFAEKCVAIKTKPLYYNSTFTSVLYLSKVSVLLLHYLSEGNIALLICFIYLTATVTKQIMTYR